LEITVALAFAQLSCNYDLKKKSYYRAFNAIFGKVGRVALLNY